MKKWLLLLICSLFGVSLSGCSLQNVVESVSPSREETPQDIHPDSTRVYMDEIQGTLQTFTGNKLTLTSSSQDYTFDVSQATLESVDGMVRGDSISVIYEGQLSGTDTSTVRTLKVVDDYHDMDSLKERTTHGQVQELTTNSITIKSKGGKTATFPITGTEQYYQNGIKAGDWVYLTFKGKFPDTSNDSSASLNASHLKVLSISDLKDLEIPDPTPTPDPKLTQTPEQIENKEKQLLATVQGVNLNILRILPAGSDTSF